MVKKEVYLLIFLLVLLITINYSWLDSYVIKEFSGGERAEVIRVIDGDTFEIMYNGNKTSVRLLGINTPEKGEVYYSEAKNLTERYVLNKTVELEFGNEKRDLYNRLLAYVSLNNENINKELIRNGFASPYFPEGKDRYYRDFMDAWNECLNKNRNLCEKSKDVCAECVKIKEWDIKNDFVIFENVCDFNCDITSWSVKDEGRKKFIFEKIVLKNNQEVKLTAKDFNKDYVWTLTGDTLFLRDEEGGLVLWENY
jgi:hypothetical protein